MIKRMPNDGGDMRLKDALTVQHGSGAHSDGPTPEPYKHARNLIPFGKGIEHENDVRAVSATPMAGDRDTLRRTLDPDVAERVRREEKAAAQQAAPAAQAPRPDSHGHR